MNTQELIDMLEAVKIGGITRRPREISFSINGKLFIPEPKIEVVRTGDGLCGPEVTLELTGKEMWEETEQEQEDEHGQTAPDKSV